MPTDFSSSSPPPNSDAARHSLLGRRRVLKLPRYARFRRPTLRLHRRIVDHPGQLFFCFYTPAPAPVTAAGILAAYLRRHFPVATSFVPYTPGLPPTLLPPPTLPS